MNKEEIINKWANLMNGPSESNPFDSRNHHEGNLLPIAMKVAAQTIGLDLVSVKPIGGNSIDEMDRIKNEIKSENRDRKIESLTEGVEYNEMKLEEHPDYRKGPSIDLGYLDFKYNTDPESDDK